MSTSVPPRFLDQRPRQNAPKGCRNKIRFPKRKQALSALNGMKAAHPDDPDNDRLNIYRCPHGCHGWHVGHTGPSAPRAVP